MDLAGNRPMPGKTPDGSTVMKHLLRAFLFAIPILLGTNQSASAEHPCKHLGCGGFCFPLFGFIHQHGPLYNYGPYAGYYPFEPYGPWNSHLQWTGPAYGSGGIGYGWNEHFCPGWLKGRFAGQACSTGWGRYASTTLHNVRCRLFPRRNAGSTSLYGDYVHTGISTACVAQPTALTVISNAKEAEKIEKNVEKK